MTPGGSNRIFKKIKGVYVSSTSSDRADNCHNICVQTSSCVLQSVHWWFDKLHSGLVHSKLSMILWNFSQSRSRENLNQISWPLLLSVSTGSYLTRISNWSWQSALKFFLIFCPISRLTSQVLTRSLWCSISGYLSRISNWSLNSRVLTSFSYFFVNLQRSW